MKIASLSFILLNTLAFATIDKNFTCPKTENEWIRRRSELAHSFSILDNLERFPDKISGCLNQIPTHFTDPKRAECFSHWKSDILGSIPKKSRSTH